MVLRLTGSGGGGLGMGEEADAKPFSRLLGEVPDVCVEEGASRIVGNLGCHRHRKTFLWNRRVLLQGYGLSWTLEYGQRKAAASKV
jgi:hypothetical protein